MKLISFFPFLISWLPRGSQWPRVFSACWTLCPGVIIFYFSFPFSFRMETVSKYKGFFSHRRVHPFPHSLPETRLLTTHTRVHSKAPQDYPTYFHRIFFLTGFKNLPSDASLCFPPSISFKFRLYCGP